MKNTRIPTGSPDFDFFLEGGIEEDIITTIYGPGGSGKTNLCLMTAIAQTKTGKKIIYMDTEGNFSVERLKQLSSDYKKVLEGIVFFRPTRFDEQIKVFDKLRDVINEKIGLIIIDTISVLYRLELGKTNDVYELNKVLGLQLSFLSEIARKHHIPVLLTNQVYADFENKNRVNMVGGNILKYSSKCLIELQKLHKNRRRAIIRKHRSIPEDKQFVFEIKEKGIEKESIPL